MPRNTDTSSSMPLPLLIFSLDFRELHRSKVSRDKKVLALYSAKKLF